MKCIGFSHYEVTEQGVTSLWKLPRTYSLTPQKKSGGYLVTDDEGQRHCFCLGLLLFAAMHNIDPRHIPKGYVYTGGKIRTNAEFCNELRERLNKKLDKYYSDPIGMIDTLVSELTIQKDYYQTGECTQLINAFYKRRDTIFADFCRRKAYGEERTSQIWERLTDQFINRINRKRPISSIDSYMLRMIPVLNKDISNEMKSKTRYE